MGSGALTLGQCFGARIRFPHGAHMTIEEHILLAPYTTFGIGGSARFFARPKSVEELKEAFAFAKKDRLKVFILGGGSNVLISDAGFEGLVLKIELTGVEEIENGYIASAGEAWDKLVERAVANDLWGIENLSGIPGTVGGAVVQNIGAYGSALSEVLSWLEIFDIESNTVRRLSAAECQLGYRDSIFKRDEGRYVVLRACLTLSPLPMPHLLYKDLAEKFKNSAPTLSQIRDSVLEVRKNKFPDLQEEGTAGSFFKNPIVGKEEAGALKQKFPGMPVFAMPETSGIKVPLAWILDHALAIKGLRVGTARLFEKQPLVIVVDRKSSAEDVKKLARLVQEKVKDECDLIIEPEVRIL